VGVKEHGCVDAPHLGDPNSAAGRQLDVCIPASFVFGGLGAMREPALCRRTSCGLSVFVVQT
jgi:hypothetical protein